MSELAGNNTTIVILDHHHQTTPTTSAPPPPLPSAGASPSTPTTPSTSLLVRDYRKGNWTTQETLILINAKRLDDERRVQRQSGGGGGAPGTPRTVELRWKWVENYCWKNGCLRSQNQCNDKWDNLLRDYKKVREYETKIFNATAAGSSENQPPVSYWSMEKHERKDRNLPSNLACEVFEALTDVLSRRNVNRSCISISAAATPVSSRPPEQAATVLSRLTPSPQPLPPTLKEEPQPLPPAPTVAAFPANQSVPDELSSESTGTEDGGNSNGSVGPSGEAKRRRVRKCVVSGSSMLARTLMACEDKDEKRHRDQMALEQRRLRIEEDRTEINRQGFAGLIATVNNLSDAIHSLVSQHHQRLPNQR